MGSDCGAYAYAGRRKRPARLLLLLAGIVIVAGLPSPAGPADARQGATCTAKQKRTAQAALAAYRKAMPKQRAAYFRKHKKAALRKKYVQKQQAKLKRLKKAAGCTLRRPAPRTPPAPPQPSPPAPPAPPPPGPPAAVSPPALPVVVTPPLLTSATIFGTTLSLEFDETIASIADVGVTVNGAAVSVAGFGALGSSVVVTLARAVDADDVVLVDAVVRDVAGDEAALVSNAVTNLAAAGFSPALEKASWADDRSFSSPEFGEWPIDHRYFLPATRVRTVMLFVDFPSRKHTFTPQQVYNTWAPVATQWFKRASFGRFDFGLDLVDRVYHLSRDDYGSLESGGGGNLRTLIAEAAQRADADVDFSKYDAVWVVEPQGGIGNRQFRPWPENPLVLDGKPILHAELVDAFVLEAPTVDAEGHPFDNSSAAHLMITHETGHHLGLPDTSYKPDPETPYDFTFVAGWDLMDNPAGMAHGGDFFAWNKWRVGWIDPNQVRGLTSPGALEETIAPVESAGGVKLVVARTSPTFLYAVEVRRRLGNDAASTCDDGVLVYTVDSTKRNGLGPKFVHAALPGTDPAKVASCGLKYAAPFDLGPGEVSTFEDANVKVEVLATDGVNYRVRVTRK